VFNILLQVLDDGRLTDGQGRTVDFRNTVVVMTSNLGSARIQERAGEDYETMKSAVMEVVGQHFRPEFINRVDEIVVLHPLEREQIKAIAAIQQQLENPVGRLCAGRHHRGGREGRRFRVQLNASPPSRRRGEISYRWTREIPPQDC
jgi:ATP-dependent Clp protease ATP-binding subunit ClpA